MPSSDASIGTFSAVTEVLSLVDKGRTTIGGVATQAAAPDNLYNHGVGGLTRIDLRQEFRNSATHAIAIAFWVSDGGSYSLLSRNHKDSPRFARHNPLPGRRGAPATGFTCSAGGVTRK